MNNKIIIAIIVLITATAGLFLYNNEQTSTGFAIYETKTIGPQTYIWLLNDAKTYTANASINTTNNIQLTKIQNTITTITATINRSTIKNANKIKIDKENDETEENENITNKLATKDENYITLEKKEIFNTTFTQQFTNGDKIAFFADPLQNGILQICTTKMCTTIAGNSTLEKIKNWYTIQLSNIQTPTNNFFIKADANVKIDTIEGNATLQTTKNTITEKYTTTGEIQTTDFTPSNISQWNNLTTEQTLNGQTINYFYSIDSGQTWTTITPDGNISTASTATGKIRFKAILQSDGNTTPELKKITATYTQQPCIEQWTEKTTACSTADTKTKYYSDTNNCGTKNNLPTDNGTITICNYCTPQWNCTTYGECINGTATCTHANDTNNCYAQTQLSSDTYNGTYTEFTKICTLINAPLKQNNTNETLSPSNNATINNTAINQTAINQTTSITNNTATIPANNTNAILNSTLLNETTNTTTIIPANITTPANEITPNTQNNLTTPELNNNSTNNSANATNNSPNTKTPENNTTAIRNINSLTTQNNKSIIITIYNISDNNTATITVYNHEHQLEIQADMHLENNIYTTSISKEMLNKGIHTLTLTLNKETPEEYQLLPIIITTKKAKISQKRTEGTNHINHEFIDEKINITINFNQTSNNTATFATYTENIRNETPNATPTNKYIEIIPTENTNITATNLTIRITYNETEINTTNIREETLQIYFYNETTNNWTAENTTVNTIEKYAETTVNHASLFGLFGQEQNNTNNNTFPDQTTTPQTTNGGSGTSSITGSGTSGGGYGGRSESSTTSGNEIKNSQETINNETTITTNNTQAQIKSQTINSQQTKTITLQEKETTQQKLLIQIHYLQTIAQKNAKTFGLAIIGIFTIIISIFIMQKHKNKKAKRQSLKNKSLNN